MRIFKAFAAIAAMIVMAACSNQQEAAAPATTTVTPGSIADFRQNVGDRVFFATDKSDLDAEARSTLQKQAVWLRRYPSVSITIEGHCDERGTVEYNQALGEQRAMAARDYLVAAGISASRIQTVSYGKERPFDSGHDE